MEYLFGWLTNDEPGTARRIWALNPEQEKAAFEAFIDEVIRRCFDFPDMHIYHFSPYEPSALKRLMGRYATREDEMDTLLRGERFVDLYTITRQAIRAGVESYSLKELEQLHDFEREFELRLADANHSATWLDSASIHFRWLSNDTLSIDFDKKLRTFMQETSVDGVTIVYQRR